ncbi:HAD family hydrolase [Winogradskyella alexanderae]|uniref:phosphoglycolate phosphatase n=1 Tax=Winogradskyella alexanderae TaxID=2877123 RepID=A0ABS7XPK7_9FLAO|nr:HAD family hydrolase [Winogradskyella alexanderae]MCA0131319.1 HAD family hydrolase [Winogradskyella alexanderae]
MKDPILKKVRNSQSIEYIFCDYYDTIVHRRVHPLKPFKIWARSLIEHLRLDLKVNELYHLRRHIMSNMSRSLNVTESEIRYETVMQELYYELNLDKTSSLKDFIMKAYEADFKAEASVQYLNNLTVKVLRQLKAEGYTLFCVSDFHADEDMLLRLMEVHKIDDLYDKVFVSASQKASKENNGLIFKKILEQENINPKNVLMVGDNPKSDITNANLHGIETHYLRRRFYKFRQKFQYASLLFEEILGI